MKKYLLPFLILLICAGLYTAGLVLRKDDTQLQRNYQIPERVISINPAATEIIFALGCQNKLAAVSDFCDYPPEAAKLVKVGGAINPNFEQISVIDPDLIIIQGQCDAISNYCKHKNIELININLRTVDEIYCGISLLGQKLGCSAAAEKLCSTIKNELEAIRKKANTAQKKKVFFSLYRSAGTLASITTIGPDTCLTELIDIAGGVNIFNDLRQDYPIISKETLMKRNPDLIIESYSESTGTYRDANEALRDWYKLGGLSAVEKGNLHVIDGDLVLKPGPRIAEAAAALAKLIQPELFED